MAEAAAASALVGTAPAAPRQCWRRPPAPRRVAGLRCRAAPAGEGTPTPLEVLRNDVNFLEDLHDELVAAHRSAHDEVCGLLACCVCALQLAGVGWGCLSSQDSRSQLRRDACHTTQACWSELASSAAACQPAGWCAPCTHGASGIFVWLHFRRCPSTHPACCGRVTTAAPAATALQWLQVVAVLNPIAGEQMQRALEEQIAGMQVRAAGMLGFISSCSAQTLLQGQRTMLCCVLHAAFPPNCGHCKSIARSGVLWHALLAALLPAGLLAHAVDLGLESLHHTLISSCDTPLWHCHILTAAPAVPPPPCRRSWRRLTCRSTAARAACGTRWPT